MSRFILDLISISLDEVSSNIRTSQWKTLHFATIVESVIATFSVDLPAALPEAEQEGESEAEGEGGSGDGAGHTVEPVAEIVEP